MIHVIVSSTVHTSGPAFKTPDDQDRRRPYNLSIAMRIFLILLFIFLLNPTFAQLTVDPKVKDRYENAYDQLPSDLRKNIDRAEKEVAALNKRPSKANTPDFPMRWAIVTLHVVDTINKDQVKPDAYRQDPEKMPVMICAAALTEDTLIIQLTLTIGKNSGDYIEHTVTGNRVETKRYAWLKYDTVFRTSLDSPRTNSLELPFTTEAFVLSDTNFVVGKTIYGYASISTNAYYTDNSDFRSGYIANQELFNYFFKFEATKGSGHRTTK